jgi:glycolate oxidase iron-sulfur subunit
MDSPRGRIDLMKGTSDGTIVLDEVVAGHIDACLGCMACVTACPSGVRYDLLIEATRARVEEAVPRSSDDRAFRELVFALFPYPRRLRLLIPSLWLGTKLGLTRAAAGPLGKLLPPRLRQLATMAPPIELRDAFASLPARTPAKGVRRARVAMVAGCVQRAFFPNVNEATIRVLSAEGCEVLVPRGQGCCGALSLHSGRPEEAKRFARALIERFERAKIDAIIINAAGCGSTLKEYGELFADDAEWRARGQAFAAKVRDVNEYLASLEPRAPRKPIPMRVAYHDACHLAHAQRVREQPRALLRTIPELELLEIPNGDQCCGSAGTYNLFQPDSAHEIGVRKVDNVQSVAPDLVASANPGCTLQMQSIFRERGIWLRAAHPIELLDTAINGTPLR